MKPNFNEDGRIVLDFAETDFMSTSDESLAAPLDESSKYCDVRASKVLAAPAFVGDFAGTALSWSSVNLVFFGGAAAAAAAGSSSSPADALLFVAFDLNGVLL